MVEEPARRRLADHPSGCASLYWLPLQWTTLVDQIHQAYIVRDSTSAWIFSDDFVLLLLASSGQEHPLQ